MAPAPIDLGPFRSLVNFSAGGYFALVSLFFTSAVPAASMLNRIDIVDPALGQFGLSEDDWVLPSGSEPASAYGYHVFSGNDATSPFASLYLVNIGRMLAKHPDPERTHIVLDAVYRRFTGSSRSGMIRCEVYRGPPLGHVIAHLDSDDIYAALGTGVRAAFQYRRDGAVGRLVHEEAAITVSTAEKRMRIRVPVLGEDHTPAFELV